MRALMRLWRSQTQRSGWRGSGGGGLGSSEGGGGGGGSPDIKIKLEPGLLQANLSDPGFESFSDLGAGPGTKETESLELSILSELDSSGIGDKSVSDLDPDELMAVADLEDVEEILKSSPKKVKPTPKTTRTAVDILMDLENKNLVPPSVSITPITQNFSSVLSEMGLERRPGIEIIPINSGPPAGQLPSSITITPIPSKEEKKEKKVVKDKDEKARLEKKRKRKREGSPGGPQAKRDPLSKPVSVSIKPTEGSPTHKHGSPKSGKPSMSALKAVSSPSKDKSKPKEKKSGHSSPKPKAASPQSGDKPSPQLPSLKNRKGCLSAVIDKLKSVAGSSPPAKLDNMYMVKPSSDGIKLTINKKSKELARFKESKQALKPGSTSPSKKILAPGSSKMSMLKPSRPLVKSSMKPLRPGGSPKPDPNRVKPRLSRSSSDKSIFKSDRKGSPDLEFKAIGISPQLVVEGLVKQLDTNFQIPKLSARSQEERKEKETELVSPLERVAEDRGDDVLSSLKVDLPLAGLSFAEEEKRVPGSPSVSVHIVKSPAPSPRPSPCPIDDELMDEALVGLGK